MSAFEVGMVWFFKGVFSKEVLPYNNFISSSPFDIA